MKKYKVNYSKERVQEAKERLKSTFEHRVCDRVPFVFNVTGFPSPEKVGFKKLATDHQADLEYQVDMLNYQFKQFPDCDRIPSLMTAHTGTGVIPSMFGAKQLPTDLQVPFTEGRVIKDLECDLPKIPERIDPYHDGWGPFCLERLKVFIEATDGEIPCWCLDHQSPFGLAAKLIDASQLMLEMYDHPKMVKQLLHIMTEAIIATVKAQREVAGNPELLIASPWQPEFYNHFLICDDYSISVLNPNLYRDFCQEFNEKLFREFGSGHLHTCGPVLDEPMKVMLETDGCDSIDLIGLREQTRTKEDVLKVKELTKGKCVCVGSISETLHAYSPSDPAETTRAQQGIDLSYLRRMNEDGGFIWVEGGTVEDGQRLLSMAKEAVKK